MCPPPRRWPLTTLIALIYIFLLFLISVLSYTIVLLASFWISHRWNHAILSNLFLFAFLFHTKRRLYGNTAPPHLLLYYVPFCDWYIIYVSPSDGHEDIVQLCGTTQEAFFCMSSGAYGNLSRAVAFKLFWSWLIVRDDIRTSFHTYVCIKLRGVVIKQRPSNLRYILMFSPFAIFNF